jgi:FixJ family two-component response regulator
MTGGSFDREEDILREAGRAGAVAFGSKPFQVAELLELVEGALALLR